MFRTPGGGLNTLTRSAFPNAPNAGGTRLGGGIRRDDSAGEVCSALLMSSGTDCEAPARWARGGIEMVLDVRGATVYTVYSLQYTVYDLQLVKMRG